MKKNIIIAAVLMLICLNNVSAQESAQVNASVTRSFEKKFPGASSVSWVSQPKGISLAKFHFENEFWVAYYSMEGNLIASGRKVKSTDQLPIKVKEALENVQRKYESKFGEFSLGSIFELTNETGTEYYIPLENTQLSMTVAIDDRGSFDIQKKVRHDLPVADPTAIAKKN